jgi:hypothetical protein
VTPGVLLVPPQVPVKLNPEKFKYRVYAAPGLLLYAGTTNCAAAGVLVASINPNSNKLRRKVERMV